MAMPVKAQRRYEINPKDDGWELKIYEGDEEIGGGFATGDDGYEFLMETVEMYFA